MGICDQNSAASLLRELPGDFIRKNKSEGTIKIDLKRANGKKYRISTKIKSLRTFERVYQKRYELEGEKNVEKEIKLEENFPWEAIFVSGYGAGIRTQGTSDFQHYVPADAVYPLFRYDVPLQNPELAVRRFVDNARKKAKGEVNLSQKLADEMLNSIKELIEPILNLKKRDELILASTGIQVKGYWGKAELGALGDGYKSTITWLLDLMSWWMLYKKVHNPKSIRGIVIVDEIEQHLHPQWQLKIMELLAKAWPRIQFISSTHSPLVISGSKEATVWTVKDGTVGKHEAFGWLAEDVYKDIMGLSTSRAEELRKEIGIYSELYYKKLSGTISKEEKRTLQKTFKLLNLLPASDQAALDTKLENLKLFIKERNQKPG